jgi:hypothetical protein
VALPAAPTFTRTALPSDNTDNLLVLNSATIGTVNGQAGTDTLSVQLRALDLTVAEKPTLLNIECIDLGANTLGVGNSLTVTALEVKNLLPTGTNHLLVAGDHGDVINLSSGVWLRTTRLDSGVTYNEFYQNVGADRYSVLVDTKVTVALVSGATFGWQHDGNHLANSLTGSSGDDWLRGNDGNDTLNGAAGIDSADYSYTSSNITANLALGEQQRITFTGTPAVGAITVAGVLVTVTSGAAASLETFVTAVETSLKAHATFASSTGRLVERSGTELIITFNRSEQEIGRAHV